MHSPPSPVAERVNVTAPEFPTFESQGQGFQVAGTLSADNGSVLEATILFDGREMLGGRAFCAKPAGCNQLYLQASTFGATAGQHTIAFQVLHQSSSRVKYKAVGEIEPDLDTADNIALGPAQATLEAGESVSFEFDHRALRSLQAFRPERRAPSPALFFMFGDPTPH